MAAETVAVRPPEAFVGHLIYFALPLGARRCLDAAAFLAEVGRTEAVRLMEQKAEVYGRAQYHAVQKEWQLTAELFEGLAALESQLAQKLQLD